MTMNVNGGPGFWRDQVVGASANPPVNLGSNQAIVTNAQGVTLGNYVGVDSHQGTAVVTAQNLTRVNLVDQTATIVDQGDSVAVQNSAGTPLGNGTLNVSVGILGSIQLPATLAGVSNGATVVVQNSAGADGHNGTAVVANGVVSGVNLAAITAMVDNNDTLTVTDASGAPSASGTIAVANGVAGTITLEATSAVISNAGSFGVQNSAGADAHTGTLSISGGTPFVRLPATTAMVDNNDALTVPVTGTYTTTATVAVANGVVTGITLS